MIQPQWTNKM